MEALNERIKRRKRRARRRRWAKRLAVCAVLVMMLLTASPRLVRDKPAPEEPVPDEAAIGWMIAQSWLSPGDVPGFSAAHPELSERFVRASMGAAPWEAR